MSAEIALASFVAVSPPASWGPTCPAWMDSAERQCGKDPDGGILCSRHRKVAERRREQQRGRDVAAKAKRAAARAEKLPEWRAELAKVDAEINRLDPPRPNDRAAYTGAVHASIRRASRISDSKVQRMAALWERRNHLASLIGGDR